VAPAFLDLDDAAGGGHATEGGGYGAGRGGPAEALAVPLVDLAGDREASERLGLGLGRDHSGGEAAHDHRLSRRQVVLQGRRRELCAGHEVSRRLGRRTVRRQALARGLRLGGVEGSLVAVEDWLS